MAARRSTRLLNSNVKDDIIDISDDDIENCCLNTPKKKISSRITSKKKSNNEESRISTLTKKRPIAKFNEDHKNNVNVSPPKQVKNNTPNNLFSPSRLFNALSIEDHNDEKDYEDEDKNENVTTEIINKYHNASKILNSGETNNLPGREKEYTQLEEFLDSHLENKSSGSLYISGQPGTGKTVCLSKLLKSDKYSHRLKKIYINCTSISTVGSIYNKIKAELNIKSSGKTEKENLAAIEKHLKLKNNPVLLVLDEIDQLCSTNQSVLYTIFEWPSKSQNIILIGIANSLDLTDRMLVRLNAKCDLKPKLLHFASYSKQQIIDIFKSRLEEANVTDIFPAATIQLLAAKVASVSGDVRRALDIGRRVIEIAERENQTSFNIDNFDIQKIDSIGETPKIRKKNDQVVPVKITQVATILNRVYGTSQNLNEEVESNFPLQQKILLCSLLLILSKSKNKDVTIGRLHDVYKKICTKRNILPVDHTEFVGLCSLVGTRGIVKIIKKKEPRLNKITLQWDQTEVNEALKDKQLIAAILDDESCLGGR